MFSIYFEKFYIWFLLNYLFNGMVARIQSHIKNNTILFLYTIFKLII
jgi:hypothetical protein